MYCKINIFAAAVLFLAIALSGYYHFSPNADDAERYESLIAKGASIKSKKGLGEQPARQVRTNVQKDIWTMNTGQRVHFRLNSAGSEVGILQQKDKCEMTESLQHLECRMQEAIDPIADRQEVRWLKAEQGSYRFPSQFFDAQDLDLSLFSLEGTQLPPTYPAISPTLRTAASKAFWGNDNILTLTDNVRLFSTLEKESFALADVLIFTPEQGLLLLKAKGPRKVLLWQEDLRMAADIVQIQRDPAAKTEQVKGLGDVRFSFDVDEETTFHEILGKWL